MLNRGHPAKRTRAARTSIARPLREDDHRARFLRAVGHPIDGCSPSGCVWLWWWCPERRRVVNDGQWKRLDEAAMVLLSEGRDPVGADALYGVGLMGASTISETRLNKLSEMKQTLTKWRDSFDPNDGSGSGQLRNLCSGWIAQLPHPFDADLFAAAGFRSVKEARDGRPRLVGLEMALAGLEARGWRDKSIAALFVINTELAPPLKNVLTAIRRIRKRRAGSPSFVDVKGAALKRLCESLIERGGLVDVAVATAVLSDDVASGGDPEQLVRAAEAFLRHVQRYAQAHEGRRQNRLLGSVTFR